MPRFTQMFRTLGLSEFIETYPHLKLEKAEIYFRDWKIGEFGFARVVPEAPYALWMPQPVLLGALYDKAKAFPGFQILFNATVHALIEENGAVRGVRARVPEGELEVRAQVVVGSDGRGSAVRHLGRFEMETEEHDFDVVWFSVPRPESYGKTLKGFFSPRRNYLILPKYPDQLQCGLIVRPGGFSEYVKKGVGSVKEELLSAHSVLRPFAEALRDFHPFHVLQARVHRVKQWARDNMLLIGDAAHTCSPAGAVGVSVAVETAIVAAEVILKAHRSGDFSAGALAEVQKRREEDVRRVQAVQKSFARGIGLNPLFSWLTALVFFGLVRTPVIARVQRKLAALSAPLKVPDEFLFSQR